MQSTPPAIGSSGSAVLPLALTTLRLLLAPAMILAARNDAPGIIYILFMVLAFLSDIFDGVIARRSGVATAALRRYDSLTDTIFYIATFYAVWILHPDVVREHMAGIILLLGLEALRYLVDFIRFRREASYHMWSAKAWGLVLFASLVALLGFDYGGWTITLAIVLGIITDIEGLIASLILPTWTHDVPTLLHAWRIRSEAIGS